MNRLEDLPFGANAKRRLFRDAYAARVYACILVSSGRCSGANMRCCALASLVTPYAPVRAISSALAGTDLAHQHHFEEAAEQYRQQFTTMVDEWNLQSTRGVTSFESRYAGNTQWRVIPAWRYETPGLGFVLRHTAVDWALLSAWLALAVGLMCFGARRLNP